MSSRATYYLLRGGELTISSGKSGAYSVDATLFGGPDAVHHLFDPPDPSYAYQDEIWCEGGFLLDADARRLRMFGGERIGYEPSLQPVYIGLLRLIWPDWDVDWAHDGIRELVELVGGLSRTVVDEDDLRILRVPDPVSLALAERGPLYDPELASGEDVVVVSFLTGDGVDDHVVPIDDTRSLLGLGPDLESHLGESFLCALPTEEHDFHVRGGAVVEPERLCLTVWMDKPRLLDFEFLARLWPGWTLHRQDEGLPHQARQTGRDPALYRLEAPVAVARVLEKLDEDRFFRDSPAVREILRGVAEADEPRRLAEHIRPGVAPKARTVGRPR